jgi:hypothetical protein
MGQVIWRERFFLYFQLVFFISVAGYIILSGNAYHFIDIAIWIAIWLLITCVVWPAYRLSFRLQVRTDGIQIAGYEGEITKEGKLKFKDKSLFALQKLFEKKVLKWSDIRQISVFPETPGGYIGVHLMQIDTKSGLSYIQSVLSGKDFFNAVSTTGQSKKIVFQ